MTERETLALYEKTGALMRGHFKLTSGLHSEVYLQSALVLQYPEHAAALGAALAEPFRDAGAVTVLAPALHWLHGWQKWEVRNEEAIAAAAHGFPDQTPVVDDGGATEELLEDDDFEDLLDIDEFDDVDLEDAEEEPVAAGS